ncbi:putative sterigmatocystin biosynthesis protein stcQ [Aspergillus udagawae]|uniref:Sterigmatocystin biosynthesis protein stcQ n=1 Tax=Aspergillus udagawae TaxID=91492 RepID=A0ABQ1B741_9EURO|nr:putative sterigmatocystin biosynthesis protein stcQ [Aspergillus udagawae]GFG18612.1 putative sterigmatocystin biosynthesis protein stcQ [Aspergillus udagawae]
MAPGREKGQQSNLHLCSKEVEENDTRDDENDARSMHDNDDLRQGVIKKAWNHIFQGQSNNHLLLGLTIGNVDLSASHPSQVQIFKLWRIYLDNVNPLLKVTHAPTLQTHIIDAASNISSLSPTLEALISSIYRVSILSLADNECTAVFGVPKKDLLTGYQFACRQALQNCDLLQSSNRDCLTALYLYLVAIRADTDPASLSSLLSVAIRIAQRMGIHDESMYGECPALEAQMPRRLWWSLIIFDNRICEMFDNQTAAVGPTWDCSIPLNLNDFELQPEMKTAPATNNRPTEMLFAVILSELADSIRHSAFHFDFTNSSLKKIAGQQSIAEEADRLTALEKTLEEKYLEFCNPENPRHFMTIWTLRGHLAKYRLLQHWRHSMACVQQTGAQRNPCAAHSRAESHDVATHQSVPLVSSHPLSFHSLHSPPACFEGAACWGQADQAWGVMSKNYEVRIQDPKQTDRPFFTIFSRIVFQAWEA